MTERIRRTGSRPSIRPRSRESKEIAGTSIRSAVKRVFRPVSPGRGREHFQISPEEETALLRILEKRLGSEQEHYSRPERIDFEVIRSALFQNPYLVRGLFEMEESGGQPDIIADEEERFVFADCSLESPKGRVASKYRKAELLSKQMGFQILSPDYYNKMLGMGSFDLAGSIWLAKTEEDIRRRRSLVANGSSINSPTEYYLDSDSKAKFSWRGMLFLPKFNEEE